MKRMAISMAAAAATLALGMQLVVAAEMPTVTDSKMDQKPIGQSSGTAAPTPGWEKLQKNKHFKSTESNGSGGMHAHPPTDTKPDSKEVPEGQPHPGM